MKPARLKLKPEESQRTLSLGESPKPSGWFPETSVSPELHPGGFSNAALTSYYEVGDVEQQQPIQSELWTHQPPSSCSQGHAPSGGSGETLDFTAGGLGIPRLVAVPP